MKELIFSLLTIFVSTMIFAYRHNLKHFIKEMYYGKEKYAIMKTIMYGDYDEFYEGCYRLINFRTPGLGQRSYRIPDEKEKTMIMDVLRAKGWLMTFLSQTPSDMRPVFLYPDGVKESLYFQVK